MWCVSSRGITDMACHNHALFVRRHGQGKAIASPGQRTYHRTARCGLTGCLSLRVHRNCASLMVQHYIEEIGQPDHLRLVSNSDVFTPTGRTQIHVIWDLSVKKIDDHTYEFTNRVHSSATPELLEFLGKQGIPWEVFQAARKPFQRLITGRRRLSSQKASNVTH